MSVRNLAIGFVVLVFALLLHTQIVFGEESKHRVLKVGEQMSISAKGVEKYSEGKAGIVDVRLPEDGTEFILVGIKPGITSLLLIKEGGKKLVHTFEVKALTDEVPQKENIRLDFYFVEIREGGQYQVGVNWPSSIGVDSDLALTIEGGAVSSATATLSGLPLPRLDVLQQGNWAKISRQASLITANGEEANFLSGGEVNIAVQGSLAAELRQIPFGTKLKILPRYDRDSGRLEVSIDAEVSDLGPGEIPTRSRSNVSTVVNVEMNQAIVLAGLQSKSKSRSKRGLPLLSQIPVIGAIFGSHGSRNEHVQNMIFIVPSVVDVVDSDARAAVADAMQVYERFSGDVAKEKLVPVPTSRTSGE